MGSYIYDVHLKMLNFNPFSPLVFVRPETGTPCLWNVLNKIPLPKLCYRPSTKLTRIKKIHLYFSESQKNQLYLKKNQMYYNHC